MAILTATIKIVLSMALGYFLYKFKILNDDVNSAASKLISFAAAPCMIFTSVLSLESDQKGNITILLMAGVGLYIIAAVVSYVAAKLLRPGKELQGTYEATMMFGNSAFLGFPIGQALMGDIGVSYLAVLNMHQNIFCWSYGVFLLTKGKSELKEKFSLKKLLNPPIVAAVIALILYFLNIDVPDLIMTPLDFVGQICSPLSMIVMGATIASFPLVQLFTKWKHYVIAAVKLVILPLIVFFVARLILGGGDLAFALTIHAMMPTAVIVSMISIIYKADSKTTSSVTGLMDILCVATIPLMWALVNAI